MGSEEFNGEECINESYKFSREDIEGKYYCSVREMRRRVSCKYIGIGNICHAYDQTKKEFEENKKYNKFIGQIEIEGPLQKEGSFLDEEDDDYY